MAVDSQEEGSSKVRPAVDQRSREGKLLRRRANMLAPRADAAASDENETGASQSFRSRKHQLGLPFLSPTTQHTQRQARQPHPCSSSREEVDGAALAVLPGTA